MRRKSLNRYPNNQLLKYLSEIKNSDNNIILFGEVGTGKTTLLNRICGQNFETSDEGYSCTREVQFSFSKWYDMIIVDFPGLNATQDITKHLQTQISSLKNIPIRMICYIIEYSTRNDILEIKVNEMLSIFKNYKSNITIIITKSENIKEKRKEDIKSIINKRFNLNYVLFTFLESNTYSLMKELNNIQKKMKNILKIDIKSKDIAKTIPILDNDSMEKERKTFEDDFQEAYEKFLFELNKTEDNDLKKALYFCFKDYKDNLLKLYENNIKNKKINGNYIDYDSINNEILTFACIICEKYEEFKKKVESQIEIKINNYNNEYNRFKKCPHCGEIWFKIIGCDKLRCGNRTRIRDTFFGRFKRYIITYINKIIEIKSVDEGNSKYENDLEFYGLTEEEKNKNIQREKEGKKLIKPIGCGAALSWTEMEDCSEESIKILKEISIDQEDVFTTIIDEDD